MRWTRLASCLGGLLALSGGALHAAEPAPPSPAQSLVAPHCPVPHVPPGCLQPGAPVPRPGQPPAAEPALPGDAFAQAPEAGTQASESFNPNMFGDLIGPFVTQLVDIPGRFQVINIGTPSQPIFVRKPLQRLAAIPIATRGTYKIADNESPRPVDRVFVNYNYFNDVFSSINPGVPRFDLHRETIGFEKTLLGGDASVGLRLPFLHLTGIEGIEQSVVGDLTLVTKYAFINNRATGNLLSAGLCVTIPTGEDDAVLGDLDLQTVYLQPWAGFIYNLDRAFVQFFTALVVPTNSEDVTQLFNDIGFGYWLYRSSDPSSCINAIVPTCEFHVNTPLNNRGSQSRPIGFLDSVNVTGGVSWLLKRRVYLGTAVAFPLTGPNPFDIEALASLNFRF